MSKENAIRFMRELKTNEKAKELLHGREKAKNKEGMVKTYAEIATELGEDISPEDIAEALKEIETEIHQKADAVSADMVALSDDDLENVAGGTDDDYDEDCEEDYYGCYHDFESWCWEHDFCFMVYHLYCTADDE